MTKTESTPLIYNGVTIRDRDRVMLCPTDMWKADGSDPNRRPNDWIRKEGAPFIKFVAENLKGAGGPHEVIQTVKGGKAPATWGHWQVGMAYAQYLRPEFHAWCNEVVRNHMEGRPGTGDGIAMAAMLRAMEAELRQLSARVDQVAQDVINSPELREDSLIWPSMSDILADHGLREGKIGRGFSTRCSNSARAYCAKKKLGASVTLSMRKPHRYIFHRDAAHLLLAEVGGAMIRDHKKKVKGQGSLRLED